jgi:hypothetical protein
MFNERRNEAKLNDYLPKTQIHKTRPSLALINYSYEILSVFYVFYV